MQIPRLWRGRRPDPRTRAARPGWAVAGTTAVCLFAGLMLAVSATNSGGADLRPQRNTELVGFLRDKSARVDKLKQEAAALRAEVDLLTGKQDADPALRAKLDAAASQAMITPVKGPAVTVTLTDAPLDVKPVGIDEDLLVVHQQDIQQVVNVLWSAGAEAMTIQGQRVVTTTGIKCVGNTVVLHGVPYAPPYVITAIGDRPRMAAALDSDEYLRNYRQYVAQYQLGYRQQQVDEVTMPAYTGALDLTAGRPG